MAGVGKVKLLLLLAALCGVKGDWGWGYAEQETEGSTKAEQDMDGSAEAELEGSAVPEAEESADPEAEGSVELEAEGSAEPEPEGSAEPEAEASVKPKLDGSTEIKLEGSAETENEENSEQEVEGSAEVELEESSEPEAEGSAEPELEGSSEPKAESESASVVEAVLPLEDKIDTASCEDSDFGCCPSSSLPQHGPAGEGCCLSSSSGCCEDSIRAREDGCGCEDSQFGCCEDGVTARLGEGGDGGCGCKETEHGCCQDQYTVAPGPQLEGCPCGTSDYGCCEDGVTVSQGPNGEGCAGCQASADGCCEDGFTPAQGPGQEGCGCAGSSHGCCPDGVAAAEGEDFQGCEERPGEACHLPKEGGTGDNFTVLWFFDVTEGRCSRFWYGGEGGNANAFWTAEECEAICISPPGTAMCFLPKAEGICKGKAAMWHYDPKYKQCHQFQYGGCLGNANRFPERAACERTCVRTDSLSVCEQPLDAGPCRGREERWYYDDTTGLCGNFTYGGCQGNKNRFMSRQTCQNSCGHQAHRLEARRICKQPMAAGSCNSTLARWSFSEEARACLPFYYSGCGGNQNSFTSRAECQATCPNAFPPELEAVNKILNIEEGGEAVLRINVSGKPFPDVTWEHGEEAVVWDERVELQQDHSVRIAVVEAGDAGTWTVAADNGLGQVVRRQMSLTVYPSSVPITVSLALEEGVDSMVYKAGAEIEIACQAEGYPEPAVSWLKNNAPLPRSDRILVRPPATLVIKRASPIDGGSYSCRGSNTEGWAQAVVEIAVLQGEIAPECRDIPGLANCRLVVKRRQCDRSPGLARICCKSCHEAGQGQGLPPR